MVAAKLAPTPENELELVGIDEAASILGCSRRSIYREIAEGRLPETQKVGGRALLDGAAVRKLADLRASASNVSLVRTPFSLERELAEIRARERREEEEDRQRRLEDAQKGMLDAMRRQAAALERRAATHERMVRDQPRSFLRTHVIELLALAGLLALPRLLETAAPGKRDQSPAPPAPGDGQ